MSNFAKIFEEDSEQILILKDFNTIDDKFEIVQITVIDNIRIDIAIRFEKEEARDLYFDMYNSERAINFHSQVMQLIN